MNDPHVVALIYRIMHSKSVSYEGTAPINHATSNFVVHVKNGEARFELKDHFALVETARELVEPFIRKWELQIILDRGPGEFELKYATADIVDRNPTPLSPGHHLVLLSATLNLETSVVAVVQRAQYPKPCEEFGVDADVEALVQRFARYREDRGTLPDMAYFCLTVLERAVAGGRGLKRQKVEAKYGVAQEVLSKLGHLTSEKGGLSARKAVGLGQDFTLAERTWLEGVNKTLIRRAAEVAHDPSSTRSPITMADLPPL
jgi:hypothetical protein